MYLLFDIGGTRMRIASSKDGRSLEKVVKHKTPVDDFEKGMSLFKKLAAEVAGSGKIRKIVGGVAGPLDRQKNSLVASPHIPGWIGKPLAERLTSLFGAPVFLENDAALSGLGEATLGAGKGHDIVAYITVSTGVGGARIVNGRIDRNALGFEPGHQIIDMNGDVCAGCSKNGHLESYVSGAAILRRYHREPAKIRDKDVWDEAARVLAVGLNNIAVLWSPDIVVLGGSMIIKQPGISVSKTAKYLEETLTIFSEKPNIVQASLGDDSGLYGALTYLKGIQNRDI